MPIISKTSGQLGVFSAFFVCLFVRILEQKLVSSGMHLMQYLAVILSKFLAHTDCYMIRGGQANRVSPQLCPGLPAVPCHLWASFQAPMFLLALPTSVLRRPSAWRQAMGVSRYNIYPWALPQALHWISKYSSDALCFPRLAVMGFWGFTKYSRHRHKGGILIQKKQR